MQKSEGFSLRLMKAGDLNQLWQWHKEHVKINFPTQKPNRAIFAEDFNTAEDYVFMFFKDKKNIGWIWYDIVSNKYENKKEGRIRYLHIDKKYRGKGYATKIMKGVKKGVQTLGAKFITLGTHVKNKSAIALYKKLGYKPYRITFRKNI